MCQKTLIIYGRCGHTEWGDFHLCGAARDLDRFGDLIFEDPRYCIDFELATVTKANICGRNECLAMVDLAAQIRLIDPAHSATGTHARAAFAAADQMQNPFGDEHQVASVDTTSETSLPAGSMTDTTWTGLNHHSINPNKLTGPARIQYLRNKQRWTLKIDDDGSFEEISYPPATHVYLPGPPLQPHIQVGPVSRSQANERVTDVTKGVHEQRDKRRAYSTPAQQVPCEPWLDIPLVSRLGSCLVQQNLPTTTTFQAEESKIHEATCVRWPWQKELPKLPGFSRQFNQEDSQETLSQASGSHPPPPIVIQEAELLLPRPSFPVSNVREGQKRKSSEVEIHHVQQISTKEAAAHLDRALGAVEAAPKPSVEEQIREELAQNGCSDRWGLLTLTEALEMDVAQSRAKERM